MNFKNESIGSISTFNWKDGGVIGAAGDKHFAVTFYNEKICRIQASRQSEFEHYPFSVILSPEKVNIDGKEDDGAVMNR